MIFELKMIYGFIECFNIVNFIRYILLVLPYIAPHIYSLVKYFFSLLILSNLTKLDNSVDLHPYQTVFPTNVLIWDMFLFLLTSLQTPSSPWSSSSTWWSPSSTCSTPSAGGSRTRPRRQIQRQTRLEWCHPGVWGSSAGQKFAHK